MRKDGESLGGGDLDEYNSYGFCGGMSMNIDWGDDMVTIMAIVLLCGSFWFHSQKQKRVCNTPPVSLFVDMVTGRVGDEFWHTRALPLFHITCNAPIYYLIIFGWV